MRIIHFSDFHLNANQIEQAKRIADSMIDALQAINSKKPIDLIIFSGDMISGAGFGFTEPRIENALKAFFEIVIDPLTNALGLPKNRFVFTIGNHEIDRNAITGDEDEKLYKKLSNSNEVSKYVINKDTEFPTIKEYNEFRDKYWDEYHGDAEIRSSLLQLCVKMTINGEKVGINCLNTAWRSFCSKTDEGRLLLGAEQITSMKGFLKDCDLKIALGHHHTSMMRDFEKSNFDSLLRRNYDIFCYGHTHSEEEGFITKPYGSCFFFNSSGTLVNNIGLEDLYINGFFIIDYLKEDRVVETQSYFLDNNEQFIRNEIFAEEGPIWRQVIGDSRILKRMDQSLLKQKTTGDFLSNETIENCISRLTDGNNKTILFVALTGLGKTRILHKAFDNANVINNRNYYYCEFFDKREGLMYELDQLFTNKNVQDGLVVIDNCPIDIFEEAIKRRDAYNSPFRIIAVNNNLYDLMDFRRTDVLTIQITQNQLKDRVNKYIDENIPAEDGITSIRDDIKRVSDGFPGLAIVLVKEYQNNKEVDIHSVDYIVGRMLNFEERQKEEQETVMRSLALFQPFPYRNPKEAYIFIRENLNITPLYGKSSGEKRALFSQTIKNFKDFIESEESYLSVRPFPLAIWLVCKWFEFDNSEERMVEIVEDIQGIEDKKIRNFIIESMCKRLEYMQDSEAAQDLISRLTGNIDGASAPFCNEKVVCSDLGSRLFLAMSSVNPGAVAHCLYTVLMHKSIAWVRNNITDNIRRNLVWALEKLCFSHDSYNDGIKVTALFAVAENEHWGNNATQLIKQWFHIMLPGTEASLDERIEVLRWLKGQGNEYKAIALDCFDNAFNYGHFHTMGDKAKFGVKRKKDYMPADKGEIARYWEQCRDELMAWIDEDSSIVERVAKLIESHAMQWTFIGMLQRLFPLVEKVAEKKGGTWEKLYDTLEKIHKNRFAVYSPNFLDQLNDFEERIRPKSFCRKLKDVPNGAFQDNKPPFEERLKLEKQKFDELADEFIERRYYASEKEIREIVFDKEYHDIWFSQSLSEKMTDKLLTEMLKILFALVEQGGGDDFQSSFFFRICFVFRDRKPLADFIEEILKAGYKGLYVRLLATNETEQFYAYKKIQECVKEGKIGSGALTDYLMFVSINTNDQLAKFLKEYAKDFTDKQDAFFAFILRYRYDRVLYENDDAYAIVKETLLNLPIKDENQYHFDFADLAVKLLKKRRDDQFAQAINKKMIGVLSKDYMRSNLNGIYELLISDYKEAIWEDFERAFVDKDNYLFSWQIEDEIGSGSGFGAGPLFINNDERLKKMCEKYPETAPYRIASMAPVFRYTDSTIAGFSDWFLWLLDNYGDNKDVLESLHANMESYSWTGSIIPLMENKKKCFEQINNHPRPEVRKWAESCLSSLEQELKNERNKDAYMRFRYS